MNQDILVSIIVPTYHRHESLYAAVCSLAEQTYSNIEVIIVADNADEKWNEQVTHIINQVKEEYPKLSLKLILNETNMGSAQSRNIGIKSSGGKYITFLDDDDIYLPEKIEMQLADMENKKADYGLTDIQLFTQDGKLIETRTRSYINSLDKESLLRNHLMYHMTGTDTLMFRKDYLEKIGLFPLIDVGDEFYLMEQAILAGGKLCYSPHCYVKAYIHEGDEESLSSGEGKIIGENRLYKEKKKYFSQLDLTPKRYIKVRHYAVLAYAHLRKKDIVHSMYYSVLSLFSGPIECISMLKNIRLSQ